MPIADLTSGFVRSVDLIPYKKKVEYFDKDIKGWYLEVRGLYAKTYYFKYRNLKGELKSFRLGKYGLVDYELVRSRAVSIHRKIQSKDYSFETEVNYSQITFGTFVNKYYLPYIKIKKRSWQTDLSFLKNHILPIFEDMNFDEISKVALVKFHLSKRELGLAPATADRLIIMIRYIFNLAIKWGFFKKINPAQGFELFNINNARERYLDNSEVKILINSLEKSKNSLLKPIILTLLLTGLRKSEVLNAKWVDLDLTKKIWVIPITKSGKPRYIPLTDMVIKILESLDKKFELIFANPKTGHRFTSIFYAWDHARERVGMKNLRIHDLRHSYASFLINNGGSLYEVQKLLGHSNSSMTQRYAHLSESTLRCASNLVSDMLKKQLESQ